MATLKQEHKANAYDALDSVLENETTTVIMRKEDGIFTMWLISDSAQKKFICDDVLAITLLDAAGIDTSKVCTKCGYRKSLKHFWNNTERWGAPFEAQCIECRRNKS